MGETVQVRLEKQLQRLQLAPRPLARIATTRYYLRNPNMLRFDFDDGTNANSQMGGLGVGQNNALPWTNEAMPGSGDSGSPGLVGTVGNGTALAGGAANTLSIVGVESWGTGNGQFGTIGGQVLANTYNQPAGGGNPAGFIWTAQNNTPYGAILDMRLQALGFAGQQQDPLTITVGRGTVAGVFDVAGPNLLIRVTDNAVGLPANFQLGSGIYFNQPINSSAGVPLINSLVLRGNDGGDTFQLIGNLGVGPITILGGTGNDNIVIGQTGGGDLDDLSQNVTVDGGGGTNTLVVNDVAASVGRNYALTASSLQWGGAASIQFSNINNFTLNASNGASNTEAITNTVAGTTTINGGTRGDAMTVLATGGVLQLNGTGGTNSFTIGEDNIGDLNNFAAEINVDGGVGGMANELVINDPFAVGGSAGRNYIDNGTSLTWGAPGGQFIGFAHIKDFTLNASNYGNNTEAILNTRPDITTINGGDLNNAFFVGSSSVANATGTLVGVVGTLNIDGGGGANTLTINDQRNTKAQTYTVTGTQVTFLSGRGAIATVAYSNVNQLTLNGGSGGNIVRVQSTSIPTGINSGSSPDTITVAGGPPNPNRLDGIQGQLVINGPGGAIGPPNDAIIINDSGNVPGWNYVEAPNSLSRQGIAPITFFNYSLLVFAPAQAARPAGGAIGDPVGNQIDVTGVLAGTAVTVDAGSWDTVTLSGTGSTLNTFLGPINVACASPTDTLILDDSASQLAETYSISATTIVASALPNFDLMYSGVKDIQIQSGTANATFALNVGSVSPELDLTAGGGINTADVEGGYLNNLNLTNFQVLNVSGGTLDLGKDLSVNDFTESGGIFTGQGNLTVTQGAVWSAGEMDGNGVTIIGSGADFSISGSTTKNLGGRTIKNWGSMTWSGATLTGNTGAIQNWLYGNLTAEGVFDGFFLNEGELTPGTGSVAGAITVNGDYEETYDSTLNLMPGDEITASGQIELDGNLLLGSGFGSTSAGTVDTLIDNTGSQAITGTFSGLAQGAIFYVAGPSSGGTWYQISYQGGSGNSVTITALGAPPATFAGNTQYDFDYNRQTAIGIFGDDTQGNGVLANEASTYHVTTLVSRTTDPLSIQGFGNNGDFYYQPDGNDLDPDSFTFEASNGTVTTNAITVGITVVDTPPVATNDSYTVAAGGTLDVSGIGVLTNDYDREDPVDSGDSIYQYTQPSHGTLTLNSVGSFVYTPDTNPVYVGTDSFTYKLSDGLLYSNVATVTITVLPVAPVAVNDYSEGAKGTAQVIDVLSNDGDPTQPYTTLVVSSVTQGTHGTVTLNSNNTVTYMPTSSSFTGTDTFTYVASNGLATSMATVYVTVAPAAQFGITGPSTIAAGSAGTYTVTALDSSGATTTAFNGTVEVFSGDGLAVLPTTATLTNGVGTFSATLKTAGCETVAVVNADLTDDISGSANGSCHAAFGEPIRPDGTGERHGGQRRGYHGDGAGFVWQRCHRVYGHGAFQQLGQRRGCGAAGQLYFWAG